MKKKIKNLRPTELNIHCKYTCPICSIDHWLSLEETKTKGFVIVCDCNSLLRPKQIKSVDICYQAKSFTHHEEKVVEDSVLADLAQCVKILIGYGFKPSEAKSIVKEASIKNPEFDTASLIKNILATIGGKNG